MEENYEVSEFCYKTTPCKPIGKCYKNDCFYYHQRENDVLFINTNHKLITTHPAGFLENTNYTEISIMEFSIALNTTIFNMNILNGDYK